MAHFQDKQKDDTFSLLSHNTDHENESDTVAGSVDNNHFWHDKDRSSVRRAKQRHLHMLLSWIRWGCVVVLQIIMIFFFLRNDRSRELETETGSDINGLYQTRE